MDWQTILTSMASSSIIAAGVGYILKRSFDKALELKFEKIKEEYKAHIQEVVRREAFIFDKQFDVLRLFLSLTYRQRNLLRDVLAQIENRSLKVNGGLYGRFQTYNSALVELLFEQRAIMPNNTYEIVHSLKSILAGIDVRLKILSKPNALDKLEDKLDDFYRELKNDCQRVDELYLLLVDEIQKKLGLSMNNDT